MCKTTQDLHIIINQVAVQLGYELISLTQYSDKSFQLDGYKTDANVMLFNSDDVNEAIDINDFGYLGTEEIITKIKEFEEMKKQAEVVPKRDLAAEARARLAAQASGQANKGKFENL